MTQNNHPAGPLDGVKVLDLTQIMAGPMCTMLLADLGANVIKIERPGGGDDTRRMGSRLSERFAAGFLALNRNKRSIALDLASRRTARQSSSAMVETADIVVENFRPGVMDRLGLGYETLAEINPRLVYASISGFGGTGPYRNRGGFDLVAQGHERPDVRYPGFPDGPPAKVGVPITDIGAGSFHGLWHPGRVHSLPAHRAGAAGGRLSDGGRHRVHHLGVVGILRHRRDTGAAGVGAPRQRAVPGPAHQRRLHQHRRGVATDVGAVLPGHRARKR